MNDGWEYRTESFDFRRIRSAGHFDDATFTTRANELGWEGWELVSVMDTHGTEGATFWIVAGFKRKLTPARRAEICKELNQQN